ncbi:MAG: ABC-F family ATP-binding cassette domain-containing protein [Nonomuraea sp.]|nr:ABC-F family ATP-binding cassette domain-containing protein [Nonomuraea sp.]
MSVRSVFKTYGDRPVLTGVSLSATPGERLAIVGDNGSGKSTLLRLLAGIERPDDGEITVTGDVAHLGQTLDLPLTHTVQQAIDLALTDLRAMERRLRDLESTLASQDKPHAPAAEASHDQQGGHLPAEASRDQQDGHLTAEASRDQQGAHLTADADVPDGGRLVEDVMEEYGELLTAFEARGGYEADARIDKAFHGLGLAHIGRDRVLSSLSGGERARLGLACVLAADPTTLLLDEPTNHLDEPALTWLEERLRGHRGTIVVVSHDRVFLDRVATAVVEVEEGSVTRFGGGYTGFLAAKAAARARWQQAYTAWREEVRQVREHAATTAHRVAAGRAMKDNNKMAYDRNAGRVQSSVASRVRNAHERLRRLEDNPVPRPPAPLHFHGTFQTPGNDHTPLQPTTPTNNLDTPPPLTHLHTDHLGAGRPLAESRADGLGAGRALVELRDVRVGERLRVGALTVRAGERVLVSGANGAGKSTLLQVMAERARGRVGYLPQEDDFDPGLTVLAAFGHDGYADERRAALLATGLFPAHVLGQKVGALSVGQRRRLSLARLLTREHDLLLLDEPTNHLSPTLADELQRALDAYRGAVVMVTHDRALRRHFHGTEIQLTGGHVC